MKDLFELHEVTEQACNRGARGDIDLNLGQFVTEADTPSPAMALPDQMKKVDAEVIASLGIHVKGENRSGTYILHDFQLLSLATQSDGFELLTIVEALKKYDWLGEKYYWKAVQGDRDKYTELYASVSEPQGFFIHVKKGKKIALPFQACLYVSHGKIAQRVHNVIVLDEGSELQLITSCAAGPDVSTGAHLGISEQYIGKNAKLTSTMIHSWGSKMKVRSYTGTIVEDGGELTNHYCSLRPPSDAQIDSMAWLNEPNASVKYVSIILGSKGSTIDTGGEVYLNGVNSSAELAHRAVCNGGHIYQRGMLIGNAEGCRGHVDCAGMVLDAGEDGFIHSVPGLRAIHAGARMSHEASIGKIAPEQVEYLQSRGMEEHQAISLIIRGFLGGGIVGISPELDTRISEIAEIAGHGEK